MNNWFDKLGIVLGTILLITCSSEKPHQENQKQTQPNIIYILADDLGYGDLSCYGQTKFSTPNIDRLASQGMLFTQHYSGSTVCAPSRSALMTGQHTGHTFVRGNKEVQPEGQYPIPDSTYTLAELLQQAGYKTGAFGKWGLGYPGSEGEPLKQGFDTFFGYNCQRLGHHYYPYHLWSNQDSVSLKENAGEAKEVYAPELIHQKTLQFIEDHQNDPFFLFVPSIIPHAELAAPEKYMAKFRGKLEPEKSYTGTDAGEDFRKGPYQSQPETHAAFAAMITLLDEQVGEIMDKVEDLGLSENTIIIFTSDNGPHLEGGADPEYFDSNGPLRGYKRDLYEGGIRVPMIAKWPGEITPNSKSDHISAFWDVFPTIAELVEKPVPRNIDGISFLPSLKGDTSTQTKHIYLYWEFHEQGGRVAVRKGDWKAVRYNVFKDPDSTLELYNLQDDIGEVNNIAANHPKIVRAMNEVLESARVPSDIFRFGQKGYLQKD